jgi:3-oxoacyl-[acyl-carrier protein] reductase
MDLGLRGKTVLVTGGTQGLGRAVCEVMAGEGANVILVSRHEQDGIACAVSLKLKYGIEAMPIAADLSRREDIDRIFAESLAKYETIDVLVNSAAIWPQAYVADMEEADFWRTLDMNLVAPFLMCKLFVQQLLARHKKGKIVNIVSQAAFHGATTGHAHYAASKGGLVSFTLSLAREMARHGIQVNAVAPGIMDTPMMRAAMEEKGDYYTERIPLGRVAAPEEVAYGVVFLTSSKADYLTGITLDATGGMLMR